MSAILLSCYFLREDCPHQESVNEQIAECLPSYFLVIFSCAKYTKIMYLILDKIRQRIVCQSYGTSRLQRLKISGLLFGWVCVESLLIKDLNKNTPVFLHSCGFATANEAVSEVNDGIVIVLLIYKEVWQLQPRYNIEAVTFWNH
ncbi:hypothetical protein AVEN_161087-1 [Araneus ventricosus]|uniref:Uncharacterized protein n=1 Tax=Araneus ventricosus TaxID=182803 RepID=A0A4Y2VIH9_ARAVE|nr:hypothetical protein AVEN_161087-1 [Araneus ventricosus]